jgi:hypothetical protein
MEQNGYNRRASKTNNCKDSHYNERIKGAELLLSVFLPLNFIRLKTAIKETAIRRVHNALQPQTCEHNITHINFIYD